MESIFKLSIPPKTIWMRNLLKLIWFCKLFLPSYLLPFSPALISSALRAQLCGYQWACSQGAWLCIRQGQSSHSGNRHPTLTECHRSPRNCGIILLHMEEPGSRRNPKPSLHAEQVLTARYWSRRWHQDQARLLQQNYCSQCQPEYLTAKTEDKVVFIFN